MDLIVFSVKNMAGAELDACDTLDFNSFAACQEFFDAFDAIMICKSNNVIFFINELSDKLSRTQCSIGIIRVHMIITLICVHISYLSSATPMNGRFLNL